MKYRIRHIKYGECIATICDGDEIELEPIDDCPAAECDGSECTCKQGGEDDTKPVSGS